LNSPLPKKGGRIIKKCMGVIMASLGLEISKAEPGYRLKRFAAFIIDVTVVLIILFIVFSITGKPDFPSVRIAMDAAKRGASGPNSQVLVGKMFDLFNTAYWQSLIIGFLYEVLTQLVFRGATLGKLAMGLRIVPMNQNNKWVIHNLLMVARSAIKFFSLYMFQGFPFLIEVLSIFANKQSRAGYDIFARTYVKDLRGEITSEDIDKFTINE
jgi:uncharacterized RDD family membrane protein YckC